MSNAGKRAETGGRRLAERMEVDMAAGFVVAGHAICDDVVDWEADEDQMFPNGDVDTGLERPASGVWSWGPNGMK